MKENHYINIDGYLYIFTHDEYHEWLKKSAKLGYMAELPDTVVEVKHYNYRHIPEEYDDFEALLESFEELIKDQKNE